MFSKPCKNQPSRNFLLPSQLLSDIEEFLIDRQARNVSRKTMSWYRQSFAILTDFLQQQQISDTQDITATLLRRFLIELTDKGHNPGGVKNIYSAVKALLNWYADEIAAPDWRNPVRKVKMPRAPVEPMEPVPLEDVQILMNGCDRGWVGRRDKAIFLALLDTGCRAGEFVALNVRDVDLATGSVMVRQGKGRKFRTVFLGAKSRRATLAYLRKRGKPDGGPLWVTVSGGRLTYPGLRQIVRRRAEAAGIPVPSLHSFRRAFALACLRNGVDLISLQRLMGHADLTVLHRYLAQVEGDLKAAHEKGGPVDNLL